MPKIKDDPIYVKQSDLASYRKEQAPRSCPIFGTLNYIPVVDHDHVTGRIRGVISTEANMLIGKIEQYYRHWGGKTQRDLITVLQSVTHYLSREQGPYHPKGLNQLRKRFLRMSKPEQILILESLGVPRDIIEECRSKSDRTKLYRRVLLNA